MSWYNLNEKKENKKQYLARVEYDKLITLKAKNFREIVGEELLPNVQYRIVTEISFNAIAVLNYLIEQYEMVELYFAIYRLNQKSLNHIRNFISENQIPIKIIISSLFRENKKYEKWARDLELFAQSNENVMLQFVWIHAKVFLGKTKCGKHVVFEGSGNLSNNAQIEQYIIEDNKLAYQFHKSWMDKIIYEK